MISVSYDIIQYHDTKKYTLVPIVDDKRKMERSRNFILKIKFLHDLTTAKKKKSILYIFLII